MGRRALIPAGVALLVAICLGAPRASPQADPSEGAPELILAAPPAGMAGEWTLQIDPAASGVGFTLGAVTHTVRGSFVLSRGTVHLDPGEGGLSGEIVVDARSGKTGKARRDRKMHRKVLRSEEYPEVVLRPRALTGWIEPREGESRVEIQGTLTLLGKDHEITVPLEVDRRGARVAIRGAFTIPYVEWGLKDPSVLVLRVEKRVEVDVSLVGTLSPREPAP